MKLARKRKDEYDFSMKSLPVVETHPMVMILPIVPEMIIFVTASIFLRFTKFMFSSGLRNIAIAAIAVRQATTGNKRGLETIDGHG